MKDVTPENMRCSISQCAAILEVTPQDMRCISHYCPSVSEQKDGYLIIGKIVEAPAELRDRVGPDETVLWVPRGLVKPNDES